MLLHRTDSDLANENERPKPAASARSDFGNRTSSGNGGARRNKGGWSRNERGLFPADELLHLSGDDKARLYRTRNVVSHVGGRRGSRRQNRHTTLHRSVVSLTPAFKPGRRSPNATKAVSTAFSLSVRSVKLARTGSGR